VFFEQLYIVGKSSLGKVEEKYKVFEVIYARTGGFLERSKKKRKAKKRIKCSGIKEAGRQQDLDLPKKCLCREIYSNT